MRAPTSLIAAGLAACLAAVLVTPRLAADEGGCRGVSCSGHGACLTERDEPLCLCDEGYAATALECVASERPDAAEIEARRRTALAGGRVVYVATAEAERPPWRVGAELTTEPYPLSRYLRPSEMWCSDFVSWVYRVAGVPFTGGYFGGWLLPNNQAIRRWFERRERWVDHDSPEWATVSPRPGDYLRFHTQSGHGHSGIVRYVDGDTLYTVEGNVGSRVRLRRYPRFRAHPRLDGIGLLTDR